jgi:DNA invertase Pin-like site-specific DNA recombinase
MKVAIYAKGIPGKTAIAQEREMRRLCEQHGWTVAELYADQPRRPPRLASGKGRLALIDDLLGRKRRLDAVCVWRLGLLGNALDDVLWLLEETNVKRGIAVVAPGDGIDSSTGDGTATKVIAALARVGRQGN